MIRYKYIILYNIYIYICKSHWVPIVGLTILQHWCIIQLLTTHMGMDQNKWIQMGPMNDHPPNINEINGFWSVLIHPQILTILLQVANYGGSYAKRLACVWQAVEPAASPSKIRRPFWNQIVWGIPKFMANCMGEINRLSQNLGIAYLLTNPCINVSYSIILYNFDDHVRGCPF